MKRWTRKNMPKSRIELDDFVQDCGLHPYGVISYKGRDIFIAETDLELDKPIHYPWGYYQVGWFVTSPTSMDKLDVGSWGEYESMHDKEAGWTTEAKRQARINDSLRMAKKWIDDSEEVGRYECA